jgi:valyl-tRNA synthetase
LKTSAIGAYRAKFGGATAFPAYYCGCGHIEVSKTAPAACSVCGGTELIQDEDTLDTWFSSALWPFSTLGWPDKTPELDYFYPTDVLVTDRGIIFFWVVRMVFSGLKFMGGIPFPDVIIHGTVLDEHGIKMSKSKGNFFMVRDILKEFDGEVIRFFLLSGHYRNPINFSDALMEQAKNSLARMQNAQSNLKHLIETGSGQMSEGEKAEREKFNLYKDEFIKAMDDDLNTADAITAIFELITAINTAVKNGASKEFAESSLKLLEELTEILGLLQDGEDGHIDGDIAALVEERQKARKEKNFARADEIRDILKERGITLKDTPQGVQIVKE